VRGLAAGDRQRLLRPSAKPKPDHPLGIVRLGSPPDRTPMHLGDRSGSALAAF